MGFLQNVASTLFDTSEEREKKRAETARFEIVLDEFMAESEIRYRLQNKGMPYEKPHEIYRYVFRRCAVIGYLLSSQEKVGALISHKDVEDIEHYAKENYYKTAPESLYGRYGLVNLTLTMPMINKLERLERLTTQQLLEQKSSQLSLNGYIYLGTCQDGRGYVGQTIRSPERRYIEHREFCSGPYKVNQSFVNWAVLRECKYEELDHWESYFIGIHDTYENGFNDNRGKNLSSYDLGRAKQTNSLS